MKLIVTGINNVFEMTESYINVLVVENQNLLYEILTDLYRQCQGFDGGSVLSENDTPVVISKRVELIDHYVPFDLNNRQLLNRIGMAIEKDAMNGERYLEVRSLLAEVERLLMELSFEYPCDVDFSEITLGSLIKASGMKIRSDSVSLGETIINYMELVCEFIADKLFITVNLRDFLSDDEANLFMQTVLSHGYKCFMIESHEHSRTEYEKRYIVDQDSCEIS